MSHSDYCQLLHCTTNSFPALTEGKPYVSNPVYRHFGHLDCFSNGVYQPACSARSGDANGSYRQSDTYETAARH